MEFGCETFTWIRDLGVRLGLDNKMFCFKSKSTINSCHLTFLHLHEIKKNLWNLLYYRVLSSIIMYQVLSTSVYDSGIFLPHFKSILNIFLSSNLSEFTVGVLLTVLKLSLSSDVSKQITNRCYIISIENCSMTQKS